MDRHSHQCEKIIIIIIIIICTSIFFYVKSYFVLLFFLLLLLQLFISIGNYSANLFWERHFKGERIPTDSPREIRESFIRSKYESKAWIPDNAIGTQDDLDKVGVSLCHVTVGNLMYLVT